AQCLNRPLHINRIPKDNSADDEIESACTVALILVTAIAEFTEPVQEDGTSQRVLSLALILSARQSNLHSHRSPPHHLPAVWRLRPAHLRASLDSECRAERLDL